MKLPVPYLRIRDLDDHQLVDLLLKRISWATHEFLYGKSYPIFKSLHNRFKDFLRTELIDFIHDAYVDIIEPRKKAVKSKLETFTYRSTLQTWMSVVTTRYCYSKIKADMVNASTKILEESDRFFEDLVSNSINDNIFDMEDVNKMLSAMRNPRYRELIRKRYVEGKTDKETAAELGLVMDNYYNRHRLAKVQFVNVLKEEGLL